MCAPAHADTLICPTSTLLATHMDAADVPGTPVSLNAPQTTNCQPGLTSMEAPQADLIGLLAS